jgi:hypothetical protein
MLRPWAVLALVVAAFAIVHGQHAMANISVVHWEDTVFLRHNTAAIRTLGDCFTKRPVWPGLYRPLTTNLYYYLGRTLFSDRIEAYHLVNVVLYLANGLLLYLICTSFFPGFWALVPPTVFVSRYAHIEVVYNTCEFQTLLSVFFTFLAFNLFIMARMRRRLLLEVLSIGAFVLALLSKETAVVFPALLLAYGRLFDKRRAWHHYLPSIGVAAIWMVLFAAILRGVTGNEPTGFTYSLALKDLLGNYSAYLLAFLNLLTYRLDSIVMVEAIPPLASSWLMKAMFAVLVSASVAAFVLHSRLQRHRFWRPYAEFAKPLLLGLAFFVITTSPYAILESRLFMRYGYVGHAGLAVCAGGLIWMIVTLLLRRRAAEADTGRRHA